MVEKTALHQVHVDNAAKLVDFSGYSMPLHYGSVIREHLAVRESAGMFDISHMGILNIEGSGAKEWLRIMLTNDVAKLDTGRGLYSCLCRQDGGVIDDLIVFMLGENHYRLYIDAARCAKDRIWLDAHLVDDVQITQVTGNAMIAVQGPDAVAFTCNALEALGVPMELAELPRFSFLTHGKWFVSRTGYTGEDGVEITLPEYEASELWLALEEEFVIPAGLGARDTLRVEAGFGVYGQDIDEKHTPAESGLERTIDISDETRQFIGRKILEDHKQFGGRFFQVGLMLDGQGLLRRGANVQLVGQSIGNITSGSYSPVRAVSVGLARVSRTFTGSCDVSVRDRLRPARITTIPFVPHGMARE